MVRRYVDGEGKAGVRRQVDRLREQMDDPGADALVLFNRFDQPDFDLSESRQVVPDQ